jgi:hypothetical protein
MLTIHEPLIRTAVAVINALLKSSIALAATPSDKPTIKAVHILEIGIP